MLNNVETWRALDMVAMLAMHGCLAYRHQPNLLLQNQRITEKAARLWFLRREAEWKAKFFSKVLKPTGVVLQIPNSQELTQFVTIKVGGKNGSH